VWVDTERLQTLAQLLRARNAIDAIIAKTIGRPMTAGHAGEWIAAQIFDIELESLAVAPAYDGHFRRAPLEGKTVNVKWYLKREGLLDMTSAATLDYYLVMTGPAGTAGSSKRTTRPWLIESVYLFDANQLMSDLQASGIQIGVATSVRQSRWKAAEIYPDPSPSAALEVRSSKRNR
jgi:hypothetical protein